MWSKNRRTDQWKRTEPRNKPIYGQMISDKNVKRIQ